MISETFQGFFEEWKSLGITARKSYPIPRRGALLHPRIYLKHPWWCRGCYFGCEIKFLTSLNVSSVTKGNLSDEISTKVCLQAPQPICMALEDFLASLSENLSASELLHEKDDWSCTINDPKFLLLPSVSFMWIDFENKSLDKIHRADAKKVHTKINSYGCFL